MIVEITSWKKVRDGSAAGWRAAMFTVYLTEEEVQKHGLSVQVVFCTSDKYRLTRGLLFLRARGLVELADTIAAELYRQEIGEQA